MNRVFVLINSVFFVALMSTSCIERDPVELKAGNITGIVVNDVSGDVIADAYIVLYNQQTDLPEVFTTSDASGNYSVFPSEGTYYVKAFKHGYEPMPLRGVDAVPFSIKNGEKLDRTIRMNSSKLLGDRGFISGYISGDLPSMAGLLVTAEGSSGTYSAITDQNGNFLIINIPVGIYTVRAYGAGISSIAEAVEITSNSGTSVLLNVTGNTGAVVEGTISLNPMSTFVNTPSQIEVLLAHAVTKDPVKGLVQNVNYSSSMSFSIPNVPDGNYVILASFPNDNIVMDYDVILNNGQYLVDISSGAVTPAVLDISIMGVVDVVSPSNGIGLVDPVNIATSTPVFTWKQVIGASDYIIEVIEVASGNVIWGGFTNNGTLSKNVTVAGDQTAVSFNYDGSASVALQPGKTYQWRIYASKDNIDTGGWNIIAASEDRMGYFKVL